MKAAATNATSPAYVRLYFLPVPSAPRAAADEGATCLCSHSEARHDSEVPGCIECWCWRFVRSGDQS